MLKVNDIFNRQEGQAFDFNKGIDVVDFFNAGLASQANQLEQGFDQLDFSSKVKAEDNTASEDLQKTQERSAEINDIFKPATESEKQFGFEKSKDIELGDFSSPDDSGQLKGQPLGARHTGDKSATNLSSFVKGFEGWNDKSYADGRQRSIGYGTKAKKGESSITREEGERRLAQELNSHKNRVISHMKKHNYKLSSNQIDALTSFDYNTGSLHKLTNNGKRSVSEIANKITSYNKANLDGKGLKPLKGLTRRRKEEQSLFIKGYK